jgi:glycosyltransferase involved in cell wall biosynthesis
MSLRIGLLTPPIQKASVIPLSSFINIFSQFSDVYLFCGENSRDSIEKCDNVHLHPTYIKANIEHKALLKIIWFLYIQITYGVYVLKSISRIDVWLFVIGGDRMVLPMMIARLFKKPVILSLSGSAVLDAQLSNDPFLKPAKALSKFTNVLSNYIILYSPNLITFWQLEKYRDKILIAHRHFLDFNTFTVTTPLLDRPPLIGYIGRLSGEKGVRNFAQALPATLSDRRDLRVLIGGDGPLKETIVASLQKEVLTARVDLPGWISHDDLPKYLNQLRLLVLPSYTEGLPNIMLEAMACGTPVLATPVGAIPDVIIDGKTGFIMENNSPECIAENVIRALDSPDLEQIAEAGRRFVGENYTFERVVERWKEVLEEI